MIDSRSSVEIMAPVGSYEALMAAIQAGAGSVYFGVGKLNMRSNSTKNFTLNDLREICRICRENDVKSYVTVNTIIFDEELDEMRQLLDTIKDCGVSAIIAADQSVIQYARQIGVEVHISTQANITNTEAVRYYSQFADVMVTARELSIDQVARIVKNIEQEHICGPHGELVRIETFCHGALCMAVSGRCYLSQDNFNTSANRGACMQPCRRGYEVWDRDREVHLAVENQYIFSPRDLCTLPFLDKLLSAGVKVLKIEGRGRAPEYTKLTVSVYREAVDAIVNNTFTQEKVEEWMKRLRSVYNRDFWDGFYLGRRTVEWTTTQGSQATETKLFIGTVTNYFSKIGVAEMRMETHTLQVGDKIVVLGPTTGVYEDTITSLHGDDGVIEIAEKGILCSFPAKEILRRGDKVYKLVERVIE